MAREVNGTPPALAWRTGAALVVLAIVAVLLTVRARDPLLAETLTAEGGVVEWLQVVLSLAAAVLAGRWAFAELVAGRPGPVPVGLTGLLGGLVIGELDLDRLIFGVKVIATRFFVNPEYPLAVRLLAVVVVVGVPLILGLHVVRHVGTAWRTGRALLDEPGGQLVVAGVTLLVVVALLEQPLGDIRSFPRHFLEESLELISAVLVLVGLAARPVR